MDIPKEVHDINNKRQLVSYCLEFDATEDDKAQAMKIFDKTTELLKKISQAEISKMKEGACPKKGCEHHSNDELNGCTIYTDATTCPDNPKGGLK